MSALDQYIATRRLQNAPAGNPMGNVANISPEIIAMLPNFLKGVGAGTVGVLGDIASIPLAAYESGFSLGNGPVPGKRVSNVPGATDWLGAKMGADVNSGAFQIGSSMTPDPSDLGVTGLKAAVNAYPALNAVLAGIFAGRNAKTADNAALQLAEQMAGSGKSREEIWNATGWFKGTDGKWRFEIDDSRSTWAAPPEANRLDFEPPLGSTISHPDMGGAYPGMDDIKLSSIWNDPDASGRAYYQEPSVSFAKDERIALTPVLGKNRYRDKKDYQRNLDMAKESLLHESQHAIQRRENFARGGSTSDIARSQAQPKARAAFLNSELSRISKEMDAIAGDFSGKQTDKVGKIAALRAEYNAAMEEKMTLAREHHVFTSPNEIYARLAGETEARNVQARMKMTPSERKAKPPWSTQDTPDDEQIVRFR